VPLVALGNPQKVWARAWRGNQNAAARDVAPDHGVISIKVK
jgi:hypothetical protein